MMSLVERMYEAGSAEEALELLTADVKEQLETLGGSLGLFNDINVEKPPLEYLEAVVVLKRELEDKASSVQFCTATPAHNSSVNSLYHSQHISNNDILCKLGSIISSADTSFYGAFATWLLIRTPEEGGLVRFTLNEINIESLALSKSS